MLKTHLKVRKYGIFEPKFSTIGGQKLWKTCGKHVENFLDKSFPHFPHVDIFNIIVENVENFLRPFFSELSFQQSYVENLWKMLITFRVKIEFSTFYVENLWKMWKTFED